MLRFDKQKTTATRFSLDIEGDVQQYALNLLHIINNAREYPHMIFKVENTPSNTVYVTCDHDKKDSVKEYLTNFGEITDEEEINWIILTAVYDRQGWNWLYSNDREIDFTVDFE